jgi:UDP-N-acetylmuramate dehydrogenase
MAERCNSAGTLLYDEPLSRYTTWRVGGVARRMYRPADAEDLAQFLAELGPDEPLLWLGLGSNLLVRDGGFPGTVIALSGCLNELQMEPGSVLRAGAGASCAQVARHAARQGLCGAAFLAGIPGTMGGALAMNAGAWGGETWQLVTSVRTIDRLGVLRIRSPVEYQIGYRSVRGPREEWFVSAWLQLRQGEAAAEQARIRALLERRNASQPIGRPSGGSTFRNPPGDHAARLIEACGLKGQRIGGAEISPRHANFIINLGDATAADIEQLIVLTRDRVREIQGVELQPEVRIVGVPA